MTDEELKGDFAQPYIATRDYLAQFGDENGRIMASAVVAMIDHLLAEVDALRAEVAETHDKAVADAQTAAFFYRQAKMLLDALETLYGDAVIDGPAQVISAAALAKAKAAIKATGVVHECR